MHPAYSIIFFTTASGAGYGLLAAAGVYAALGLMPADRAVGLLVLGPALALVTAGLLSSTAHLGRPERAWRAFSQWRTSWLSREGVAALATYLAAAPFAAGWLLGGTTGGLVGLAGLLTALLSVVTIVATGMIYASLKPIAAWRNGWTVPVYLGLAAMTGLLWLSPLARLAGHALPGADVAALVAVVATLAVKEAYWRHVDRHPGPSTTGTATGLGRLGPVRLFEAPHTESSYLLREMGFRVARRHAARLRHVARGLAFGLPLAVSLLLVLTDLGRGAEAALGLAGAASATAGVLVERWLFFAEARHTVMLYYGAQAA